MWLQYIIVVVDGEGARRVARGESRGREYTILINLHSDVNFRGKLSCTIAAVGRCHKVIFYI